MAPAYARPGRGRKPWLLTAIALVLPVLLVASAWRTYLALDAQRDVFLRQRASLLAAELEAQQAPPEDELLESLAILTPESAPELASLWEGRELFRTQHLTGANGTRLFRAWVPFHAGAALRIARLDLREEGADFLVEHARHHLWLVLAGGGLIIALWAWAEHSRRRAAAAERRQLELAWLAQLGEMSAVLAHEIRNPLGTIKGYAQLLGEQLGPASSGAALLAPVLAETTRLEALVRDLLLYGRPAEPRWRPWTTGDLARLLGQQTQLAAEAGLELQSALVPFTLETDPDLVEQILLNLLRNAFDAARGQPDAWVRLEAAAAPDGLRLTVTDSGPGFSPAALARLYEPFATTKASGTGLGLSISRKLAAALGGHLHASNGEGGGACVELWLPARPPREAAA